VFDILTNLEVIILQLIIQYFFQDINSIWRSFGAFTNWIKTTRHSWSSYDNLYWFV